MLDAAAYGEQPAQHHLAVRITAIRRPAGHDRAACRIGLGAEAAIQRARQRTLGRVKVLVLGTAHPTERRFRDPLLAGEFTQLELCSRVPAIGVPDQLLDVDARRVGA